MLIFCVLTTLLCFPEVTAFSLDGTTIRRIPPHLQSTSSVGRRLSEWPNWTSIPRLLQRKITCAKGKGEPNDEEEYTDNNHDDEANWEEDETGFDSERISVNGASEPTLKSLSLQVAETQKQLSRQQKQIDQVLQYITSSKAPQIIRSSHQQSTDATTLSLTNAAVSKSPTTTTSSSVVPLRVMVFIDGTWVFYSLFRREHRCPIAQKYGFAWAREYRFDWEALPRIICRALQQELNWSSDECARPLEITRMSVFTSYKADTAETSQRYQLFQDMRAAGYDVHQMETVGSAEKCVDIQLAVEMMHFATVPNSFDIAVLLSGDKDFMPALIRVRQKGRKVAIVSMKSGVNRALYETDGLKDFEMIWLEDYLDELIVPRENVSQSHDQPTDPGVHFFVYLRLIWEFIAASGLPAVSSRDVGRFLKSLQVEGKSVTEVIKANHGSLGRLLKSSSLFEIDDSPNQPGFMIRLNKPHGSQSLEYAQRKAKLRKEDLIILNKLLSSIPTYKETAYFVTLHQSSASAEIPYVPSYEVVNHQMEKGEDFSKYTVAMLKERCRERGLSTSGLKADLVERVKRDAEEKVVEAGTGSSPDGLTTDLIGLVTEYLHASGGTASSRDIGRYLAANMREQPGSAKAVSANAALKAAFGSLNNFVATFNDLFEMDTDFVDGSEREGQFAFRVSLRK